MGYLMFAGLIGALVVVVIVASSKTEPKRSSTVIDIERIDGTDWIITLDDGSKYRGWDCWWRVYPTGVSVDCLSAKAAFLQKHYDIEQWKRRDSGEHDHDSVFKGKPRSRMPWWEDRKCHS